MKNPDDEVKDPSELSEEEQEARQTGKSLEEVRNAKATEETTVKKPKKKSTKKTPKPSAKKAPKAPAKKKAPAAKTPKKASKGKAYVRKGEKNGKKSNRGPKGNKNPVRDAADGGVFGRKIAKARKEKGWSQRALAEKVGCTQPAICNIEKGTVGAGVLGVTIAKLLKLEAPEKCVTMAANRKAKEKAA